MRPLRPTLFLCAKLFNGTMIQKLGIAIIGYGYWGPNLVRNFDSLSDCEVRMVADASAERLQLVQARHSHIATTTNTEDVFSNPSIDAVVIATPVFTHYQLAKKALQNGKHVLLEKPMTQSAQEAKELMDMAAERGLLLMVDHTFLYTGAVQKIKQLADNGELGHLQYFDSTRINLGLFQSDINVLWDLAPHDISILLHLIPEKPVSVAATGISHTFNRLENIAYLTVKYASDFIAHFSCSWSSPVKIRTILVGGDKRMVLFNDVEPTEKVKVYDTGFEVKSHEDKNKLLVDYRVGDIYVPKLEAREALSGMAQDFVSSIKDRSRTPVSHEGIGYDVVRILEAAQQSMAQKGAEVTLDFG